MASVATDCGREASDGRECYEFTLLLSGIDDITSDIENKLFDAGCDDATLGIHAGVPYLAFDREANSLADAITSAITDVNKASLDIEIVRVILAGDETISVINAWLRLRREFSRTLPKELAHKVDEIMRLAGAHDPAALQGLLSK